MERIHIYQILDGERDYQNDRWQKDIAAGKANYTEYEWLVFIQDYLTEAIRLATRGDEVDDARIAVQNSIRKITAMGVACMEQNGCPEREGYERLLGSTYHPRTMKFTIPIDGLPIEDVQAYLKRVSEEFKNNYSTTFDGELMFPDSDITFLEKKCDCKAPCSDDSCDCGDTQHDCNCKE